MVFSSVVFLFFFLPVFMACYAALRPLRIYVVVVGSLLFYGWGDLADTGILLGFILVNWSCGLVIQRAPAHRRLWMRAGCAANILALIYFKYRAFLLQQLGGTLNLFGVPAADVHAIALPLGISFFSFQGVSYLVDVYRGNVRAQPSLLKFAMYKAMFPQLIAGPIVRYSQIAGEIDDRRFRMDDLAKGVRYFIIGLAQKVLVANTVATAADQVFDLPPDQVETSAAWLGAVYYMVQIYFDFGGYTNMAIGLGHMIGFSLPQNFDHPYLAQSMTDFWRRWHMTLSRWFRDYLYIPLGGNRYGALRTYRNLLITFLLCGLWHGAAWTFAIWGLYHGLFLILERRFSHRSLPSLLRPLRHAYVLLAVLFGWVIFRSDSLAHAFRMSQTMVGFGHQAPTAWPIDRFATRSVMAALLAAALITVAPLRHSAFGTRDFAGWMGLARNGLTVASLLVLFCLSAISLSSGTYNPFIYFRF